MLFLSFYRTLVGKLITVELKNDLAITGTLHSYLNIKLENTRVDENRFPHMRRRGVGGGALVATPPRVRSVFIRGSVVRYVILPADGVDVEVLHDATRREARGA